MNPLTKQHKYDFDINITQKNDARVKAFDFIQPGSKVLDVGSACGHFGQILKTHKRCDVYGMEYDPESIQIAEEKNAFTAIYQVDLNNFDLKKFESFIHYFDYIVFGDVLEHLMAPEKIIKEFQKLLKPQGHCIISLPNTAHASVKVNLLVNRFEYEESGILDKTHVKFYTHESIPAMLKTAGLLIVKFDYTVSRIRKHSAERNLHRLPSWVRYFIFKDDYSYVSQYVMLCRTTDPENDQTTHSKLSINKMNRSPLLAKARKKSLRKYVFLYFIEKQRIQRT